MRQFVIDILIDLLVSLSTELLLKMLDLIEIPGWLLA